MIRLLVVDDEKIVLDSVSHLIRNGMEQVAIETARNGKEGLLKLESFKPHILMTDIRMPGISGLELIRQARITDTNVKILIVTAFEEFEYAREAFKYDVEDYILKPLSKGKLLESMSKIVGKIEAEQARRDEELESIEKVYASIALAEGNFFQSIFLHRSFDADLEQYRQVLSIALLRGFLVAVEVQNIPEDPDWRGVNRYHSKLTECAEYLRGHIRYHQNGLVSPAVLNRIFIYIETEEGRKPEETLGFWEGIHDTVLKRFGLKVKIAVGPEMPVDGIGRSYDEVMGLIRQANRNISIWTPVPAGRFDSEVLRNIAMDLSEQFQEKSRKWKETLSEFRKAWLSTYEAGGHDSFLENLLVEQLAILVGVCRRAGCLDAVLPGEISYVRWLQESTGPEQFERFERLVEPLGAQWFHQADGPCSPMVQTVRERLESQYAEDLRLEQIAGELGVTPQYLSGLFRQETGLNFKEYLTQQRIKAAQEHLKAGTMALRDIGYAVGYNDPNYFIRSFKKTTGMTPKEYQRVMA